MDKKKLIAKVQVKLEQITGSGKIILISDYDGVIQGPKGEKDWHYFLRENAEKDLAKGDEVVFDLKKIAPKHTQAINVKKSE